MQRALQACSRAAVVGVLVVVLCNARALAQTPTVDYHAMMRATIDSWVTSQSDKGFLPYGFDFLTGEIIEPERLSQAQLIRQIGTMHVIAKYYARFKDPRLLATLRRALTTYGALSLPIGKGSVQEVLERSGVLSLPVGRWKLQSTLKRFGWLYTPRGSGKVISHDGTYQSVVTGAVALALLTEITYSHSSGDESFAQWRSAWLDGLLTLHVPGAAGFRESPESIDDDNPYVNAQGWLALAVYADAYPNDARVAKALRELDRTLIQRYSERPSGDFYHWGTMAAAQRFRTTHDAGFLAFLQQQALLFVDRLQAGMNVRANNCARMEGVASTVSAWRIAEAPSPPIRDRMIGWLLRERDKLPELQIRPGQHELRLGGNGYLEAPRMPEFAGAFLWGLYDPTTRIDAGAHCISAMVMMEAEQLLARK